MTYSSTLEFYVPRLLEKMLKCLGFTLKANKISLEGRTYFYLSPCKFIPRLRFRCQCNCPTGHLAWWVSRRQVFDQLCISVDSISILDTEDLGSPRELELIGNPFKGIRSLEELKLRLALLGEAKA